MIVEIDSDAAEKAKEACVAWFEDYLGPEIADRARRYAPKESGSLAASVEDHVDGTDLIVSATGGRDGREYAAFVELGHRVFHPTTGEVGPEWVPARPFLRPALYGGAWGGPIGSKMGRVRVVMWKPEFGFGGDIRGDRIGPARHGSTLSPRDRALLRAEEQRALRRERAARRAQEMRDALSRLTPEQNEKFREAELRRERNYAAQQLEDQRTYSIDPVTGERVYRDEAAESAKQREAKYFAEKWRLAHPGEPRDEAPPF